ncbi:MAG TPA: hypothetical protein VF770_02265 [Solirubrobacterales bacterium]
MRSERGQGTVEWVGVVAVVALLLVGLVAAGARLPGTALARAIASSILCAAALADTCDGDEPELIAAYGSEVGELVRRHMPSIVFERSSRAMPVDFRRCRSGACGDGSARGIVRRTDRGLPVTAFVHVVDCRAAAAPQGGDGTAAAAAGPDCAGGAAGNLYIQYWTYYADSATLRGVPVIGALGYHVDDWESAQVRIGPDGRVDERASSHHGYNHRGGFVNWGSDAGIGPLEDLAEATGARTHGGWGPETRLLFVAGGSHAGSAAGILHVDRLVRGHDVHLVPLEPIRAAVDGYRFAIVPPWRKQVWSHPEATGTD